MFSVFFQACDLYIFAFLLFCSRLLFFLFLSITEYSILPSKITNKLWQKMYPTFKEMLNVQFTTVLYLEPLTTMNLILFFYLKIYLFQLWFLIMHNRQRTKFTFLQEKTPKSFSLLQGVPLSSLTERRRNLYKEKKCRKNSQNEVLHWNSKTEYFIFMITSMQFYNFKFLKKIPFFN